MQDVVVTVEALDMAYGDQIILEKAALSIHEGERVALVGRNGCGKSTFMKILADEEEPDSGTITRRKGLRVGYLSQEFGLDETLSIYENIRQGIQHITGMVADYESLLRCATTPPKRGGTNSDESASSGSGEVTPQFTAWADKALKLEERINQANGWTADHAIDALMTSLKCPPKEQEIQNLSGGEKRRVALAKTLISHPDLIILDEPTNHLDTMCIEWLENVIRIYTGTCLFVTHDRCFLDRVATRIVELRGGSFHCYKGCYSEYLETKARQREREETLEEKRQKFLKKELEWLRRGPKARTTKAQFRVNRYYETAAQKALEEELDIDLVIPPPTRMGNRIVDLIDVTMAYGNKVLFSGLTHKFGAGSKIGIIGPNGVGKTTLTKTIIGQIRPLQGTVEISPNTQFNIVDQERLTLNDEKTVVDEIGEGLDYVQFGEETISVWGYLKRYLFTDERIRTKIGRLSGGERARLLLAKILKRGGNFIVLDEPTNDLDLSTLRLLEDTLTGFRGCVLIVSHDRYFLNRVCSGILAFEHDNRVTYHEGNYDYYMSKRAQFFAGAMKNKESKTGAKRRDKSKVRKLKWKEERELETMEETIMRIEEEIKELERLFMTPNFFKESHELVREAQEKLKLAQLKRDQLYTRWEQLESIRSGATRHDG